MTVALSPVPFFRSWDNNGNPLVGGLLYTYVAGTSTPQATYTDSTQSTLNTNPVVLNFRGEASVWLNTALTYKLVLTDSVGNLIWSQDQIAGGYLPTAQSVGMLLYPQTAAEIAAGVTPTYYYYPPGDSRRYGVTGNGITDDAPALNNWIKVVIGGKLAGTLYPGTFLVNEPILINTLGSGFSLLGTSSNSCIIVAGASFSGSTAVAQLKGNGQAAQWTIGGFTIQPSASGSGSAVIGLQIGDPTTPSINVFGYQSSQINDVYINDFATCLRVTHSRLIRFTDCSCWNQNFSGGQNTGLLIDQNGSFTGDLIFDTCQFVTTAANTNACMTINSPVGPYNTSNGNYSISGVRFSGCIFYHGVQCAQLLAAAGSYISDIWFDGGTQFEGISTGTVNEVNITSSGTGTAIEDVHVDHNYVTGAFSSANAGGILLVCGSGAFMRDIFITNNYVWDQTVEAINVYSVGTMVGLVIDGNVIKDCEYQGGTGSAIVINGATDFSVTNNSYSTGGAGVSPNYLVNLFGGSNFVCTGNSVAAGSTVSGVITDSTGNVQKVVDKNPGYNPIALTAITVTASPFTFTNTTGAPAYATISGGTVSSVTVRGIQVASATGTAVTVPPGASAVVTYSAAPTMNYMGI